MATKTVDREDGTSVNVDTDTGEIIAPAETPSGAMTVVTEEGLVAIRGDIVAAFEGMLSEIPEAGGEGLDNILAQIMAATTEAGLDAPWRSDKLAQLAGTPIVVTAMRRAPSDYDGGLAWYLIVEGIIRASGEPFTFTTGATSVVAQLVRAWSLGRLPITVIPRRSVRPSKAGFYAWHLEVVR